MKGDVGFKLLIEDVDDIVSTRRQARDFARSLGFGLADQTRLATAVSEITRNTIQYAGGGVCHMTDLSGLYRLVIRVVVLDSGPGIQDLDLAITDGFSTGNGLGAGLSGCERLCDFFEVESAPGVGTCVTLEIHSERLAEQ